MNADEEDVCPRCGASEWKDGVCQACGWSRPTTPDNSGDDFGGGMPERPVRTVLMRFERVGRREEP